MGHYLYRHFNKAGKLLYVGISICALERLRQHRNDSAWFEDIATVEIEKFHTAAAAMAAEIEAIKREKPLYNKAHSVNPRTTVADFVPPQESPSGRRALQVGAAAAYLGISASLLRKYRMKGPDDPGSHGPKFIRLSPQLVVYKVADLEAWLDQHAEKTLAERRVDRAVPA